VKFSSPSECYQLTPSPSELVPCGAWSRVDSFHGVFTVPTASSAFRVHFPGFASPGTFRLQVFSTSWRVTPPRTSRVYFTPLTSLGFCPPEPSPRPVPWHLVSARCPRVVVFLPLPQQRLRAPVREPCGPREGGARSVRCPRPDLPRPCDRLQGFAHVPSSFSSARVLPLTGCRCSPGLCPL
jgi:hypothetical protein